jgi:hypothetical protein
MRAYRRLVPHPAHHTAILIMRIEEKKEKKGKAVY